MSVSQQEEKTMIKLSERAMLTSLHIGAWSGSNLDREVTEEISERHKADAKDAGRYSKQLVSKKFLKQVGAQVSAARSVHRILTLPWDDDGTRILSTSGYQDYTDRMRRCRIQFEDAVTDFVKGMPEYIKEAKVRLGTMFDANDYPSAEDVKAKFSFDVEVKPVPDAGDFRAKLSDATVKSIVKDIERRSEARIEAAMRDVYERVYDCTSKMAEKLKDADGVFRDSLVYNINELADLIPALNITDDAKLNDLAKKLKEDLVEHSPEILRSDAKVRQATAKKAEALAKKARSFLG